MNNLTRKHRISVLGWGSIPPVELNIWGGVLAGVALGGLALAGWFAWQNQNLPLADAGAPGRSFGPNSLGMEFREILFKPGIFMACREVTAGQYVIYLQNSGSETKATQLLNRLRNDMPVNFVNFSDAKLFADWLTKKERTEKKITQQASYRLPKDEEWSLSAGLIEDGWRPELRQKFSEQRFQKSGEKFFQVESTSKYGIVGLDSDPMEWCEDMLPQSRANETNSIYRVVRGNEPTIPWERIGMTNSSGSGRLGFRLGFRLIYVNFEESKR